MNDKIIYLIKHNKQRLLNRYLNLLRYYNFEIDLKGADLSGLNLEKINLSYANFEGANLSGANFYLTHLDYANFKDVNLRNSKLEYTGLGCVYFKNADLESANINGLIINKENVLSAMKNIYFSLSKKYFSYIMERIGVNKEVVNEFYSKYKINDIEYLHDLRKNKDIEDMYNNKYFVNIVLKILRII
jgi:hypothetical protein